MRDTVTGIAMGLVLIMGLGFAIGIVMQAAWLGAWLATLPFRALY